jgi:ABC-2 type transport system permease protein
MMRRYASLYGLFFVQRLKIFLEYRLSFLIGASSTLLMQAAALFTIWAVMRIVPNIVGWSFDQVLLLFGMVTLARSFEHMFADNLWALGRYIRQGDFDRFLVRPIDPFFHLLADRFNHDGIGNFLIGLLIVVRSSITLEIAWSFEKILCLVLAILGGGLVFIALNLITCVSAFWIGDSVPVTLAVHEWHEFAKYPLSMYGGGIKNVLTYLIPYGLISYYPAQFVVGRDSSLLAFAALPMGLGLFWVGYLLWGVGLRRYGGTGS